MQLAFGAGSVLLASLHPGESGGEWAGAGAPPAAGWILPGLQESRRGGQSACGAAQGAECRRKVFTQLNRPGGPPPRMPSPEASCGQAEVCGPFLHQSSVLYWFVNLLMSVRS